MDIDRRLFPCLTQMYVLFRSLSSSVWRRLQAQLGQTERVLGRSGWGHRLVQEMGQSPRWFPISVYQVVGYLSYFMTIQRYVFKGKVRRLIHRAHGLHGDWEERLCRGDFRVLFALPGSSQFSDFALSTSCSSDVRLCQSAHNCDVPDQQL